MAKKVHKNRGITLIKKANNLVESRYKFDIWETRVFLSVLGQIRKDDSDLQVYRIWYKDVIKTFGLKSGDSYALLRDAANSLMSKSFFVNYEADGAKRETRFHILRKIDYLKEGVEQPAGLERHEYIDVTVEQEMRPLLIQLQQNFTAYDLRNVVKLGVYGVRLYELLKQYENFGTRTLKVDEMKRMFEVADAYKLFGDFYRWVVVPAEKEINKHTDLIITSIEKMKEGKKVVALRFKFRTKTAQELNKARGNPFQNTLFDLPEQEQEDHQEQPNGAAAPVEQTEKDKLFLAFQPVVVGEFGVSPSVFLAELEHSNEEQISQAVRVTQRAKKEGKIKNLSGFFIEALRQGFTDPKEELEKKKVRDEEERARKAALEQQLEVLRDEMHGVVNDKIRAMTSADPGITGRAIEAMRENPAIKIYIANKEKELKRPLEIEDFRTDKRLREWVKSKIIEANKEEFESIFAAYETKAKDLKGATPVAA